MQTMRDIQDLIGTAERYKNVLLQKRFTSKKNTVSYVILDGQPRVLKWFVPGLKKNMDNEYSVLKKGHTKLYMPYPFEKDTENNVLILSYIIGENISDIINTRHTLPEQKQRIVQQLADWFVQFHSFFKEEDRFHIRGDAGLRNFIFGRGHIWGVDFEESRISNASEDLAALCASLLTSDPMFTDEKFHLCQIFLDAYRNSTQWIIEKINAEIAYAVLARIQWRQNDEERLRAYAKIIRNKGLQVARDHSSLTL